MSDGQWALEVAANVAAVVAVVCASRLAIRSMERDCRRIREEAKRWQP